MKNLTEVVATLAGLTEEQVNTIVEVVNNTRSANEGLAKLAPRKPRGRKPGTKNKPKEAAAPAKKAAKKSRKAGLPDSFSE